MSNEKLPDFLLYRKHRFFNVMLEVTESTACKRIVGNKTIVSWRDYKKDEIISSGPKSFKEEKTTVWSFPNRGTWATHTPQYRGNWAPEVVRNLLNLYSNPGDLVLDPMVGGGTTPVECRLLGRNSISVDINPDAISITRDRLDFPDELTCEIDDSTTHRTFIGDTRCLDLIEDNSIDLITAHPPYADIIKYTNQIEGDLSLIENYTEFFSEFRKAIREYYRVLRPGRYCALLIGDTHNQNHYVPIAARMMFDFLRTGFFIKENIIKKEWNCESDQYLDKYKNSKFLLTMHENLFIFKKPGDEEYLKNSSIDLFLE